MLAERPSIREDASVILLLVLLLSAVYFDVLILGNNFFTRDLTSYHYPMKKVVRDAVLSGDSLLWNPMFSGGQPMAANPAYEVFYPPQWLTLIPDYNLGFRLHILVHAYLAAIGAFLLLRALGARQSIAFLGGAAFVLGGPFVSVFNLLPFLFSVAWTPWIALFAFRYFETRSRRDLALLVFFLGMQALICEPTTLLQTWFLLGLWAAWREWHHARSSKLFQAAKGFLAAVVVAIAGVMVAAVQFLPALDFARDTVRRNGFSWEVVTQWSFPPLRFLEFVYPNFFGIVESGGPLFWGGSLYRDGGGAYFYSVYIGLPFFLLGIAGLLAWRRGSGFVLAALAVSGILAVGSWSPLFRIIYDAGLPASIRYPEKFILMGAFVMLAWGCLVLEHVLRGDSRAARATFVLLGITGLVAAAISAWSFSPSYVEWFNLFWPGTGIHEAMVARVHWIVALIRAVAFLFAIELARRTNLRVAMVLLVMFVIADLAPLGNQVNPRMPRRFFDAPPMTESIVSSAAGARITHLGWLPDEEGVRYRGGYDAYWLLRNELVPTLPAVWGGATVLERDVDETQLSHTRDFMRFVLALFKLGREEEKGNPPADRVLKIARLCNAGVVVRLREGVGDASAPGGFERFGSLETVVPVEFERIDHAPRYYFASQVVTVDGVRDMFESLAHREHPSAVAFVQERGASAGAGLVHSVTESRGRIDLDVEALGDALLVASVSRHRYWNATVDGVPVDIRAVNHTFQGIEVPPGRHRVMFRYWNPVVPACAAISLVMLVGLIVLGSRRRLER